VVLGILLGGPLEERFIQTVTAADGSLLAFFNRPLAAGLGVLCIALWGWTAVRGLWSMRKGTNGATMPK
jgi:TctA family transporter